MRSSLFCCSLVSVLFSGVTDCPEPGCVNDKSQFEQQRPSDLSFGQAEHEAVEFGLDPDLAGQPAGRQPICCNAVEQCVLLVTHGWGGGDPVMIGTEVAGGAHGVAAAFGHDRANAVTDRKLHDAAGFGFNVL